MIKETEPEAYSLKIPAQDPKPEKKVDKPVKAEPKKAEKEEPAGDGSPDADDNDDDDQVWLLQQFLRRRQRDRNKLECFVPGKPNLMFVGKASIRNDICKYRHPVNIN